MRSVNLIPSHRREAASRRRRVRRWLAGGGVYAVILLGICTMVQMSGGQDRALASAMANATGQEAELQLSLNAKRTELANAVAARGTLSTLADPPDWSLLLIGLRESAGNDTHLRGIHLSPEPSAPSGTEPPQSFELKLDGISRSQAGVSAFVQSLRSSGLFCRVDLIRSGREAFENGAGVAFDIHCVIDGNRSAEVTRR